VEVWAAGCVRAGEPRPRAGGVTQWTRLGYDTLMRAVQCLADVNVCTPSQSIAPVQRERPNHRTIPWKDFIDRDFTLFTPLILEVLFSIRSRVAL